MLYWNSCEGGPSLVEAVVQLWAIETLGYSGSDVTQPPAPHQAPVVKCLVVKVAARPRLSG